MKKKIVTSIFLLCFVMYSLFSQNLLTNGNFENGFIEWENVVADGAVAEFSLETTDVAEGTSAMKVDISTLGTNEWSVQSMHSSWPSVAGTEYKLTLYAKAEAAGTAIRAVQQLDEYDAQDFSLTTTWQKYEWIFNAKENNQQLKFHLYSDGVIYIDNIIIAVNTNTYPSNNELNVDENIRFQTMEGLGGALAFYQNWVYAHPNKEKIYQLVFEDLGINLIRLRNSYRYESDFTAIEPEFVQKLEEYSDKETKILMCSWSPPADLKSNENVNNGTLAQVDGEFVYQEFADYWRDALDAYKAIGVVPDWIGIQNEPDFLTDLWETCKFTPSETDEYPGYDVALDYVYDAIDGMDSMPLIVGAEELGIGYNNFNNFSQPIMDNNNLWAYGYHLYHGGDPELPDSYNTDFINIAQNYSNKPNIMTEYEHLEAGWFKTAWLVSNNISYGNCSAYFYWDLIWPGSGLIDIDNPWDLVNWRNDDGFVINPHFYAYKHFSKFIEPGYQRVQCTNTNDGIRSSVFISQEGDTIVMVLLNIADNAITTNVLPSSYASDSSIAYQSVEGNYFQSLGEVPSDGQMTLPTQSITTFVFVTGGLQIDATSVSLSDSELTISPGNSATLTATVLPSNASDKSVVWSSDNVGVATVSTKGVVSAIANGTATITATTSNGLTAQCIVTVKTIIIDVDSVGLTPVSSTLGIGETVQLYATVVPSNASSKSVSWSSSNTSIATVSSSGLVTAVAVGDATITVITEDGNFTATAEITVLEQSEPCDNPVSASMPLIIEGEGSYCYVVLDDISSVNSWNTEEVTINGEDYTNTWSTSMPEKINGYYYIAYKALYSWSHFEATALKSADDSELSENIIVYPNPFNESLTILLKNSEEINKIDLFDQTGKLIHSYRKTEIKEQFTIGESLQSGLYYLKVFTDNNVSTLQITKN